METLKFTDSGFIHTPSIPSSIEDFIKYSEKQKNDWFCDSLLYSVPKLLFPSSIGRCVNE
jgi:hypothetical protein